MKRLIIILFVVGIAGAIVLYSMQQGFGNKEHMATQAVRIAIFTPITHSALEEIEQGFKDELQKLSTQSYDFIVFNAQGNRTLLRAQAEELVNGNYDLIFSIGAVCSQTVAELIKKKGKATPHVFAAVDGPDFALSLQALNRSTTGVYVKPEYIQALSLLFKIKPDTKNILLVYDPTQGVGLEKYKQAITAYSKEYGATVHGVEVYQAHEIQPKVAAALSNMDVVFVLTDNTVVAGIDSLITLCDRFGVPLFASDVPSGTKGAAVVYAIREYESGTHAAYKAQEILEGKKPHDIPVSAITNFQIYINKDAMKKQNLVIATELLQQLEGKS